jgi:hypothetical protein
LVATVVFPQPPFVFITTILCTTIHRKSLLKEDERQAAIYIGFSGEYLNERACRGSGYIL